ncbi:succinyl-diaminopimelate desuccinylase [Cellulomonas fimi]|uniref:Succinyl-diaminopimelate desuccinylase n=1 Tax=Cellulomonas fimi (strain ATCC 484 / DSM 20113 / JCM 1341 / CCUG 24087 / LMG 16345 / NBRC 15513 / NCIMB 8980 / NCTC 7547 / NRS-133) TaxID=590998 RepID=F4H8K3_CELFA|nr:succinyl-diaminopimelate desuccinylase [Cellulomonas fimi]AEE47011.1 succinyl-diaminopimelate desuccinylase [Cellulomonas fimi ATCC 484]NNH07544.1 succinyl-diaminopimelate desuccinylase [Cellulomonas fimi]VEH34845.1 Succinyl-diaminopimelate desuccinylase [Cellulomonas fimi]
MSGASTPVLDLRGDLVALTRAVCDVPSVSGDEATLADAVETALRAYPHLEVLRDGDAVVARTRLGRGSRVVVAGHLDTVPLADNLPTRVEGEGDDAVVWGRGTVDMKAGVAVQLALAAELDQPAHDVTWVFYDHEEVAADLNGLGRLVRDHPDWVACDFAVLCEPTDGGLEGGCNGTLRAEVRLTGVAAHSARAWTGRNAIHAAGEVLRRLEAYEPAVVEVDGLEYREGLNAVLVSGGTAANVIPDSCVVTVNYRFAPSRDVAEATAHVQELFAGYDVVVTDAAPGARPGLQHPAAAAFADVVLAVTGGVPAAKLGWTDVARFSALGVPAVNFGPGDPLLAHKDDERCPVAQIHGSYAALRAWLTA